jgi:hypothetical protein
MFFPLLRTQEVGKFHKSFHFGARFSHQKGRNRIGLIRRPWRVMHVQPARQRNHSLLLPLLSAKEATRFQDLALPP